MCGVKRCEYYSVVAQGCDYERLTGCVRPCGEGKKCEFSPMSNAREMVNYSWSRVKLTESQRAHRLKMREDGMSIAEIAEALNLQVKGLKAWFSKYDKKQQKEV